MTFFHLEILQSIFSTLCFSIDLLKFGTVILKVWIFFQAEDGIRDVERSRGLGDVYKRQVVTHEYYNFTKFQQNRMKNKKVL